MGHDPFSPICETRLNVLCIPATKLSGEHFRQCVAALQSCSLVSLKSVQRELVTKDAPRGLAFLDGSVLLDIGTQSDGLESADLFPVIPNRQPQIALGIVDAEYVANTSNDEYQTRLQSIHDEFQRYTMSFQTLIFGAIVVFGGVSPQGSEEILWVDTEGSGPSVPNVLARAVKSCYQKIPIQLQLMRQRLPELKQSVNPSPRPSIGTPAITSTPTSATFRMGYGRVDNPPPTPNLQAISEMQVLATLSMLDFEPSIPGLTVLQESVTAARLSMLHAMLNLQTGQWPEALRQFTEGAIVSHKYGDALWYARALEGILTCLLMHAWAQLDFVIPPISHPGSEKNASSVNAGLLGSIIAANRASAISLFASTVNNTLNGLTDLLPQLVGLILEQYERATATVEESDLNILVCEARVRWTNLLIAVKDGGGVLQASTIQTLLDGEQLEPHTPSKATVPSRLALSKNSLCKLLIDTAIEAQVKLSVQLSATIQISVVRSLSRLGLERKQGFYMKEFLQKLGPALTNARRIGAAEVGMHPSASLPLLNDKKSKVQTGAVNGIGLLLDIVTRVYGLSSRDHAEDRSQQKYPEDRLAKALNFWSATQSSSDLFMKLEILSDCIELSDAVPDPQGSLYFTSHLIQAAKKAMTLSIEKPDTSPYLAAGDQSRLLGNMKKTILLAEKLGIANLRAEFWDKFLVRNAQLIEDPHTNRLIPHTVQDLSVASSSEKTEEKRKVDPFIFNPFAKAKSVSALSVVTVGELATFSVVLQNALDIDVEVEDITLTAEGCDFEASHHSIVLGPLCCQAFTLSGIARSEGELKIVGCKATIRDCYEEEFRILPDDWKLVIDSKQRMRHRPYADVPPITLPVAKQVSVRVINPFPVLAVVSSSTLQPSVMLLEGEDTLIEVCLRNNSVFDVDFIVVTFEDAVKQRLDEALTSKDLGSADLYEIQHQMASHPAVRLVTNEIGLKIESQREARFTFAVSGQPGLSHIDIMFDYAHLGKSKEMVAGTVYTRQLTHTFTATINGSVDIQRCLALPLQNDLDWNYLNLPANSQQNRLFQQMLHETNIDDKFILLVDLRNVWPQPLRVELSAKKAYTDADDEAAWNGSYTVSEVLQPGQMSRVLLLVPRLFISDPYVVIPSLDTKRQFVVSTSKSTLETEIANRESFWYREYLLRCLRGSWKEANGSRFGAIDMRKSIRLNPRMIDVLRVDHVDISFRLTLGAADTAEPDDSDLVAKGPCHYAIARNVFATLKTTIRNRSTEDLRLMLRLQPSLRNQPHNLALDLSKKFAWSGVLQQAIRPILKAGESREVELDIIVLATGNYEVSATVEDIKAQPSRADMTAELGSSVERRIWHARHPCFIDCT